MALPTSEERFRLGKIREKAADILKTEESKSEPYLIRWLRARDSNADKAENMLRNSMKWRAEKKVDDVLEKKIDPYFDEKYPFWMDMVDREGRAVLVMPIGKWDIREVVEAGRIEEFEDYINKFLETLIFQIKKSKSKHPDWPHTEFTGIIDWDGFTFRQMANMSVVNQFLQMAMKYEAHYPEILNAGIFINTNAVFAQLFKLMKPLLAKRTVEKIQIYGTAKEEWAKPLLDVISKEQLLPQHGGTKIHGSIF